MITVELWRAGDAAQTTAVARGRTLEAALRNAGRKLGPQVGRELHIQRFPGGGTLHVQFGHTVRGGGLSLGDLHIAHVS